MSAGFEFLLVVMISVWCVKELASAAMVACGAPPKALGIIAAIGAVVVLIVALPLLGLL